MRLPKELQKKIALERVKELFKQAEKQFKNYPERSNRYITLARKIAMKVRLKIPSKLKKRFCKHCYKYLQPGVNCRVRTRENSVVYYCFNCKKEMRFPFVKEKKARRKS